jgi:hypothetical protein
VRSLENKIKGELSNMDEKYQNAKVEIIMPNTLASYVNSFPSLCLKLKRLDNQDFLSHSAWAELPDMRVSLKISEKNQERLKQYQQEVRDADRAIHIRVNGEPGIGKTRFVLEMLREEDLAPNVIYYETPQVVYPVLINHVSSRDKDTHVILVVDECDRLQMMDLWRRVEGSGDRVKLITIYSEADEEDVGGETKQVEVEGLDDLQIANIIGIYGAFPIDQINRWIPYCSGFPRVAHVLGQNLVTNPEDLMKSPDTVPVWERFIAGKAKINSPI